MALWNSLGQVANMAQLAGVDAFGLVSMIMQAMETVRTNRKTCEQLVRRVQMIGDLLQRLQNSEMMQHRETREPLNGLEETLRHAYMLITSCQDSNYVYRFFKGGKHADQFREVQNKIDFYLNLFPVISHIDTTRLLVRILNGIHPPVSEDTEEVPMPFTSQSNPDARTEVSSEIERVQEVIEPSKDEEGQLEGLENVDELLYSGTSITPNINRPICYKGTGHSMFSFSELVDATENFSFLNEIGEGGYGIVYKGVLSDGREVAIKRMKKMTSPGEFFGNSEFDNEREILPKLQHTNILTLLGCCFNRREKILVYEFMPNGSLDRFTSEASRGPLLDWSTCFRIIEGIAQGVVYLHKQCRPNIIHGDLKPSNILLDSDMNPKISDFGIAIMSSPGVTVEIHDVPVGTLGFVDPGYIETGRSSIEVDVYAFGVMLLMIISGRRPYTFSNRGNGYEYLSNCAWDLWTEERWIELIDPSLRDEPQLAEIRRCIQIALLCVQDDRADRPTMWDVVLMLSSVDTTLPFPKQPWNMKGIIYLTDECNDLELRLGRFRRFIDGR